MGVGTWPQLRSASSRSSPEPQRSPDDCRCGARTLDRRRGCTSPASRSGFLIHQSNLQPRSTLLPPRIECSQGERQWRAPAASWTRPCTDRCSLSAAAGATARSPLCKHLASAGGCVVALHLPLPATLPPPGGGGGYALYSLFARSPSHTLPTLPGPPIDPSASTMGRKFVVGGNWKCVSGMGAPSPLPAACPAPRCGDLDVQGGLASGRAVDQGIGHPPLPARRTARWPACRSWSRC